MPAQKRLHRHFARGVEGAGVPAPLGGAGERQRKAGVAARIDGGKVQGAELAKIDGRQAAGQALGVGERHLDGQLHGRNAHLGEHGAVGKLDHGMDDALAVDEHLDLRKRRPVQVHRLDDFKPLIEHGGAVYGDLGAHVPVGVRQRPRGGDGFQLLQGHIPQGAAAGGEEDLAEGCGAVKVQALPDGGVLAVYGQDARARARGLGQDQLSARHQALFIGEGYVFARSQSEEGRLQPRKAGHRHQHHVCPVIGARLFKGGLAAPAADAARRKRLPFRAQGGKVRPHGAHLLCKRHFGGVCRHGDDAEIFGIARRHGDRLPADGARTADEGDVLHAMFLLLLICPQGRFHARRGAFMPAASCRAAARDARTKMPAPKTSSKKLFG